jgi:hypothetical protein
MEDDCMQNTTKPARRGVPNHVPGSRSGAARGAIDDAYDTACGTSAREEAAG